MNNQKYNITKNLTTYPFYNKWLSRYFFAHLIVFFIARTLTERALTDRSEQDMLLMVLFFSYLFMFWFTVIVLNQVKVKKFSKNEHSAKDLIEIEIKELDNKIKKGKNTYNNITNIQAVIENIPLAERYNFIQASLANGIKSIDQEDLNKAIICYNQHCKKDAVIKITK